MIGWAVQWTIISLVLILLVHYLYSFFIDTLTVPKVKDLVNKPIQQYNDILSDIKNNSSNEPKIDTNEMQNELRDFLSNIKKSPEKPAIETYQPAGVGGSAYSTFKQS